MPRPKANCLAAASSFSPAPAAVQPMAQAAAMRATVLPRSIWAKISRVTSFPSCSRSMHWPPTMPWAPAYSARSRAPSRAAAGSPWKDSACWKARVSRPSPASRAMASP